MPKSPVFEYDTNDSLRTNLKAYFRLEETDGTRFGAWGGVFEKDTDCNQGRTAIMGGSDPGIFDVDPSLTLADRLVAYWKLDETSGTRRDSKGSSHLTDNNTVTQSSGIIGPAAQFTKANSEYLSRASNSDLTTGDIDYTIACWIYLDSLPSIAGSSFNVVTKYEIGSPNQEYLLQINANDNKIVLGHTGTGADAQWPTALTTATWYFVVAWHDAVNNQIAISVNGGSPVIVSTTGAAFSSSTQFLVGAVTESGGGGVKEFMNGRIDELGFWKKVLSSSERRELYQRGRGNTFFPGRRIPVGSLRDGLSAYYTLDEASGTRQDEVSYFEKDTDGTLTRSLVAYWQLGEPSGTRIDSKGSSHLTDNNTVTRNDGKVSKAAQFVAANTEYLSITDNAALSMGDIDFSIACWVFIDSFTGGNTILGKGDGNVTKTLEYYIHWNGTRFVLHVGNNVSFANVNADGTQVTGQWYFIVAWHDSVADTINIQIDNGTIASTSWNGGSYDSSHPFEMGAVFTSTGQENRHNGRIDEVGIWKKVLTAQERQDLYNDGLGNPYHGGHHLTDNNTVTQAAGKKVKAGQFTKANSEYLSLPDNDDVGLASGRVDFTIACWVYIDSLPGDVHQLIHKGEAQAGSVASEYAISLTNNSPNTPTYIWQFTISNGADFTTLEGNAGVTITTGTWLFLVAWYDGIKGRLFFQVNNNGIMSASHEKGTQRTSNSLIIGARNVLGTIDKHWDGRIEEIGIWKRTLTAKERSDLYNSGNANSYSRSLELTDNNTVGSTIAGVRENAADFEVDNSEYLSLASNTSVSVGDIDFTFSAWIYFESKATFMTIVAKSDPTTGSREYRMRYNSSLDRLEFTIFGLGSGTIVGTVPANSFGSPPIGQWLHVVGWHDSVANTVNIQIDGGAIDSVATIGVPDFTSEPLTVGADTSGNASRWDGFIDELGFWKRILTAQERRDLYLQGRGNALITKKPRTRSLIFEKDTELLIC